MMARLRYGLRCLREPAVDPVGAFVAAAVFIVTITLTILGATP
jgi:hypothetical protein